MSDENVIITELEISQFMRLKFAKLDLGPGLTLITGKNGQGKTSVLKAIAMLFGGAKFRPKFALRSGARRGRVLAKLSNGYKIRAVGKGDEEWSTILEDANGREIKKTQTVLNTLWSELTFNALEYLDMPTAKQLEIYRKLGGADFTDLEAKRKNLYDERTQVNRALATEKAVLNDRPHFPDAPAKEISYPTLTKELNDAHKAIAENGKIRREAANLKVAHDKAVNAHTDRLADVEKLREQLRLAEHAVETALADVQAAFVDSDVATAAAAKLVDPDTAAIQSRIQEAEGINSKVRQNSNRRATEENIRSLEAESQGLTDQIDDIDGEKLARLKAAEANMPVKGMSLSGDTVLYKGLPLDQMSGAESVVFCVEVGAALHPGLSTILLDDVEKLNADRLKLLAETAISRGLQVIACKATEGGPGDGIVIEDGGVKGFDTDDEDDDIPFGEPA